VNQLLQLCLDTLEAQLQQPSHTLLAGAIKCLDALLTWFDDELPAGGNGALYVRTVHQQLDI
jgi:hypothetical protein